MNLLQQLLAHDVWTTRQLLLKCGSLNDEQLDREFDIGHRSLRATFEHLIYNMEVWSALIADSDVAAKRDSDAATIAAMLERLDAAAERLKTAAVAAENEGRWEEQFEDRWDGIRKKRGTAIAHVLTHSMHHRAQLLYLMRLSGLTDLPEGDVFSWEAQQTGD